jgi:hypothetical protein
MMPLSRFGAAAAVAEGIALFGLTIYFGILFPGAGLSAGSDFGDPSKYLPVVAAHPSWFHVPAWGLGLVADALFLFALVALRERLHRASAAWGDAAILFGIVGVTIYLVGHSVNVAWAPELIADYRRTGTVTSTTAERYVVLSRIYNGAMLGGSVFTGIALVLVGGTILRARIYPRLLGALAIAAGLFDVASIIVLLPPALPLTGVVLIWLGVAMWRTAT